MSTCACRARATTTAEELSRCAPRCRTLLRGFAAASDRLWSAHPDMRQFSWPAGNTETVMSESERESMEFDVVIVGAGPAGLAAAIRLKQVNPELSVVVLEKGSEVGAHILSGAVVDPVGIDRLLPGWRDKEGHPFTTPVTDDRFLALWSSGSFRLPNFMMPPLMSNHGNFIVSLGNVCRWLAGHAEALGVEIYPGFAAAELTLRRRWPGHRRDHRRHGRRARRHAWAGIHARHGAARQICADRRGRARLARQAADRQIQSRRGPRPRQIRHRPQGALAGEAGESQGRAGPAFVRLAARRLHRRRLVPLSFRRQSRGGRLRRPPQLQEPLHRAVRGIPALQDPSGDPRDLRGRQAHRLRRPRHHRGRLAVGAETLLPGRRADRLLGRLRQRAAHQGFAQRGAVGNAGRRACRRGDRRWPGQ